MLKYLSKEYRLIMNVSFGLITGICLLLAFINEKYESFGEYLIIIATATALAYICYVAMITIGSNYYFKNLSKEYKSYIFYTFPEKEYVKFFSGLVDYLMFSQYFISKNNIKKIINYIKKNKVKDKENMVKNVNEIILKLIQENKWKDSINEESIVLIYKTIFSKKEKVSYFKIEEIIFNIIKNRESSKEYIVLKRIGMEKLSYEFKLNDRQIIYIGIFVSTCTIFITLLFNSSTNLTSIIFHNLINVTAVTGITLGTLYSIRDYSQSLIKKYKKAFIELNALNQSMKITLNNVIYYTNLSEKTIEKIIKMINNFDDKKVKNIEINSIIEFLYLKIASANGNLNEKFVLKIFEKSLNIQNKKIYDKKYKFLRTKFEKYINSLIKKEKAKFF